MVFLINARKVYAANWQGTLLEMSWNEEIVIGMTLVFEGNVSQDDVTWNLNFVSRNRCFIPGST